MLISFSQKLFQSRWSILNFHVVWWHGLFMNLNLVSLLSTFLSARDPNPCKVCYVKLRVKDVILKRFPLYPEKFSTRCIIQVKSRKNCGKCTTTYISFSGICIMSYTMHSFPWKCCLILFAPFLCFIRNSTVLSAKHARFSMFHVWCQNARTPSPLTDQHVLRIHQVR